jgi:serine-type D-Ala-D-Ala carboxypeptidase/endopeptidase (penicillin-binding protein 4)
MTDKGLGGHLTGSVMDVASGELVFSRDGAGPAIPASTAKLVTATAVLHARGPAYRIGTHAVAGANPGEVVLVGGGDPTLAAGATSSYPGAARLDRLAEQVRTALNGAPPTKVLVDSSLYVGPTLCTSWFIADAKAGFIAHITALMTDGARKNPRDLDGAAARYEQPDLAAGQQFARALGLPTSAVRFGTAPANAQPLGEVLSPPVSRLVEMMIQASDNIIAEGLARQVALARNEPASFDGAAQAVRDELGDIGISSDGYHPVDGSGLSHENRVTAELLTTILATATSAEHPELRSIVTGLPVAGYSGTLFDRFKRANAGSSAAGIVRAKTGTLTGVDSLAGLVVDADGRLLAFSMIADATTNFLAAEAALDRIAAALATCGCS